jgi:hypothetical protein
MPVVPFPHVYEPANRLPPPVDRMPDEPVPLWTQCPWTEELNDYDKRHIALFARLLHDASEGASLDDLAIAVFRLTPSPRVREIVRSHLIRAEWIADTLIPYLGW